MCSTLLQVMVMFQGSSLVQAGGTGDRSPAIGALTGMARKVFAASSTLLGAPVHKHAMHH